MTSRVAGPAEGSESAAQRREPAPTREAAPLRAPAAVQRLAARGPVSPGDVLALQRTLGNRAVQRLLSPSPRAPAPRQAPSVHEAAAHGTRSAGGPLPYLDRIQRAFGRHDVSGVRAHTDTAATAGARAMGAVAFAHGDHVAFAGTPTLHTAAHEAAHVVQQRAGVHLKGGVGEAGDPHERHADAVADRVVQGESAEAMLDTYRGTPGGEAPVQRRAGIEYETGLEARVTADMKADNVNAGWVKQNEEMMDSGAGWQIVSDNSKLEFVTDPPVTLANLPAVVNNMIAALQAVQLPINAATPFQNVFNQAPPAKGYTLLPYQRPVITGTPQGTIGIPFNRLYSFFELLRRYSMTSSEALINEHQGLLADKWRQWRQMPNVSAAEQKARTDRKAVLDEMSTSMKAEKKAGALAISPYQSSRFGQLRVHVDAIVDPLAAQIPNAGHRTELKGVLHFIGQYMLSATAHEEGYKKKAFVVMARSSFHSMYQELHATAQAQLAAAATALQQRLGFAADAKAFPEQAGELALSDWIDSIVNPVNVNIPDDTQAAGYRSMNSDLMTAPGAMVHGGHETDGSMGSMGLDNHLVVVELRSLHHFTQFGGFTLAALSHLVADLAHIEANA